MGAIAEVYRKTRKTPDLFWNKYVCRPVAAVLVHALRSTSSTPNQVTLISFVVAVGAAAILGFWPGYWGLLVGVVVYELSYVLDCADGMLARLRNTQSTPGHLLDFLMDELKAFLILGTVAVRLYLESGADHFLLLGIGGLVCLASGIAMTTFLRQPEIASAAPESSFLERPRSLGKRAVGLVEGAAKLLIHYPSYILLVAIADRIDLYFYPYIAVNALYVLRALLTVALRFGRSGPTTSPPSA
jgi:phosphatidylglycerophosphate synthase